jgi:hypothetical protein
MFVFGNCEALISFLLQLLHENMRALVNFLSAFSLKYQRRMREERCKSTGYHIDKHYVLASFFCHLGTSSYIIISLRPNQARLITSSSHQT